jgi:UDP-glucose 6-dehydrogenase
MAVPWPTLDESALRQDVRGLLDGECAPFYEPGMQELQHLGTRFFPVEDLERAIREATLIFLCVGTPQKYQRSNFCPDRIGCPDNRSQS